VRFLNVTFQTCVLKTILLLTLGGLAEGQVCADPGARTLISASRILNGVLTQKKKKNWGETYLGDQGSSVRRPGSEDPQWREQHFYHVLDNTYMYHFVVSLYIISHNHYECVMAHLQ
jgi:hypothetical protein